MKKREVNLSKSSRNIAEEYTNIVEGLQKDAIQNSWDARLTKKGTDWKLIFTYLNNINALVIEDFGTTGMNEERWAAYQGHWYTTKTSSSEVGSRGQGKLIFHYFSSNDFVLTETIDEEGVYRFSYGNSEEWDEDKKLLDFIPNAKTLNHQGTRIWIIKIKRDILNELLNQAQFEMYIASDWWEIIRNWDAQILINLDGIETRVTLPNLSKELIKKHFQNERIKDLGIIKNLVLTYHEEEVPGEFRGIAVQRAGMTILRLVPTATAEFVKNKITGYCNFDESLETKLLEAEFPNHFGFRNVRSWNYVKEHILNKIEVFVQEVSPRRKEIAVSKVLMNRAVQLVNRLIREYTPELLEGPTGPHGKPKAGRKGQKPKPPIRIDTFWGSSRKLEFGDTLIISCELINETDVDEDVLLELSMRHSSGSWKVKPTKFNIALEKLQSKKIPLPLIDFSGEDPVGEYKVSAVLKNKLGSLLHQKTFQVYLHFEPPLPKGKVFLKEFKYTLGKGKYFEKWRNLPINEGKLRIIFDHPDFIRTRENIRSEKLKTKEFWMYSIKLGIDEAMKAVLTNDYNNENLTTERIKEIMNIKDQMLFDAIIAPEFQ